LENGDLTTYYNASGISSTKNCTSAFQGSCSINLLAANDANYPAIPYIKTKTTKEIVIASLAVKPLNTNRFVVYLENTSMGSGYYTHYIDFGQTAGMISSYDSGGYFSITSYQINNWYVIKWTANITSQTVLSICVTNATAQTCVTDKTFEHTVNSINQTYIYCVSPTCNLLMDNAYILEGATVESINFTDYMIPAVPEVGNEEVPPVESTFGTPTIISANISPTTVYTGGTLFCNASTGNASTVYWNVYNGTIRYATGSASVAANLTLKNYVNITTLVGGEVWKCGFIAWNGTANSSEVNTSAITVSNALPQILSANISPTTAYTGTTLFGNLTCTDTDVGDTITGYCQKWNGSTKEGALISATITNGTMTNLCNITTAHKSEVRLFEMWCGDGTANATAVNTTAITVSNTAPSNYTAVALTQGAYTNSLLTCTPSGSTDADSDSLTNYCQFANASTTLQAYSTTCTFSCNISGCNKGSVISCLAKAYDGTAYGVEAGNETTIGNTAPVLVDVNITPTTAYTGNTLFANISCTDFDSDTLTGYVQWWNGTAKYGSVASATITNGTLRNVANQTLTKDGETWLAEGWCGDGTVNTSAKNSSAITILPPPPSFGTPMVLDANISGNAITGGKLFCNASVGNATKISWKVYNGTTTYATGNAAVTANLTLLNYVNITTLKKSEVWKCGFMAENGTANSSQLNTTAITVSNTAPSNYTAVALTQGAYTNSLLTCTPSGSTDADSDSLTNYCQFANASTTLQAYSTTCTFSCNISGCNKGSVISCLAKAYDGTAYGVEAGNETTIGNTAPVLVDVNITPTTAYTGNTLFANISCTDFDSDTLTGYVQWWNGTAKYGSVASATITNGTLRNVANQTLTKDGETWLAEGWCGDGTVNTSAKNSSAITILPPPPSFGTPMVLDANISGNAITGGKLFCNASVGNATKISWKVYNGTTTYATGNAAVTANLTLLNYVNITTLKKSEVWKCGFMAENGTANSSQLNTTAITIGNTAPTLPVQELLADNTNTSDNTPLFNWTASTDADSDAITYAIQICNDIACSAINQSNYTVSTNSYTATTLADATYYWRIWAITSDANSTATTILKFRIDTTAPTITNPAANITSGLVNATVKINATVTDSTAVSIVKMYFCTPLNCCNVTAVVSGNTYFYILTASTECNTSSAGMYNYTNVWSNDTFNSVSTSSFLNSFNLIVPTTTTTTTTLYINITKTVHMRDLLNFHFIQAAFNLFNLRLGGFLFILIYFIICLMLYIKTQNILVPLMVGIVIASVQMTTIPVEAQTIIAILISIGIMTVLFWITKGRD
jgi:hypothetical protein